MQFEPRRCYQSIGLSIALLRGLSKFVQSFTRETPRCRFHRTNAAITRETRAMSDAVDILLYIALGEEFDFVMTMLGRQFQPQELPGVALTGFFGTIASTSLGKSFLAKWEIHARQMSRLRLSES
jgi:hypothetical protein